jgi:hypothetical protein
MLLNVLLTMGNTGNVFLLLFLFCSSWAIQIHYICRIVTQKIHILHVRRHSLSARLGIIWSFFLPEALQRISLHHVTHGQRCH